MSNDNPTTLREDAKPTTQELVRQDSRWQELTGEKRGLVTNYDCTGKERFRFLANVTGPRCKHYDDCQRSSIKIKWFYAHEIEMINPESGDSIIQWRVVLVEPDETAYAFISGGVYQSLRQMVDCFGFGPYVPPVEVEIIQTNTKNGRRFYSIVPVE